MRANAKLISIFIIALVISMPVSFSLSISSVMVDSGTDYSFVSWKTDDDSDSSVYYGKANPDEKKANSSQKTKEHRLALEGISPGAYSYKVKSCNADGRCGESEIRAFT